MKYKEILIIGAGFSGAVTARVFAEKGYLVHVIEKRNEIGGNANDYYDTSGILVHKYGPHIFHTNNKTTFDFLSRFTDWYNYEHKVVANIFGKEISIPFNFNSIRAIYNDKKADLLIEKLHSSFSNKNRITILELMDTEDKELSELAEYIYNNIFAYYSKKQWGVNLKEIDKSVFSRVPILLSEDDRYFQDTYQGMPKEGYTKMFEKMLNHNNIKLQCGIDASEILKLNDGNIYVNNKKYNGNVVYTGSIDELFNYQFGILPYRTLDFKLETYDKDFYQSFGTINYTVDKDYTRITEFKHLTGQKFDNRTVIMKEYPRDYDKNKADIPYYSIANKDNEYLYEKYKLLANEYKNLVLLGRLAEYRYYNMNDVVDSVLELFSKK